ncbi:unnamed protein product [Camellia sinensis]
MVTVKRRAVEAERYHRCRCTYLMSGSGVADLGLSFLSFSKHGSPFFSLFSLGLRLTSWAAQSGGRQRQDGGVGGKDGRVGTMVVVSEIKKEREWL